MEHIETFQSDITALSSGAATIVLRTIPNDPRGKRFRPCSFRFNQLGVRYYSDAAGTPATPGAGTVTFTAETFDIAGSYQSISGGVVNGTANGSVQFTANCLSVKAVFAGITTATHVQVFLVSNPS